MSDYKEAELRAVNAMLGASGLHPIDEIKKLDDPIGWLNLDPDTREEVHQIGLQIESVTKNLRGIADEFGKIHQRGIKEYGENQ